jgi:hypothetical protein
MESRARIRLVEACFLRTLANCFFTRILLHDAPQVVGKEGWLYRENEPQLRLAEPFTKVGS